jgi:hypothetical protein
MGMKAGRELNFLIATQVMGIETWPGVPGALKAPIVPRGREPKPCAPPDYTTDIAYAWAVVKKLTEKSETHFELSKGREGWHAGFDLDRPFKRVTAIADTAPHAICLAALKAVGEAQI